MTTYAFKKSSSCFFKTLKDKVDAYFTENNIHPAGNTRLYVKSVVQVAIAVVLYVVLVFFTPSNWASIVLCVLFGINLAVIGFNVMHEGGHQSFSRFRWLNTTAAYFLNLLGGNAYYWKVKHNINHHTYTNIEGLDSDIDVKPFMRLHEGQSLRKYHRFQHYYWVVLYAISYIAWIFYEDFQKYFSGKISANGPKKRLELKEQVVFWLTKIMYVTIYIVIPIIFVGFYSWIVGFLVATAACGLTTSIVFQLAHVVEGTEFHSLENNQQDNNDEWAIHQIKSTSNFATRSKFLHWMLGGLNFQIEHHLFPKVSHIHYPEISRLVKEACRENNIVYHEHRSLFAAMSSHIIHLRRLGRSY